MKKWMGLLAVLLFSFTFAAFAQQAGGNGEVKNTCEISGGTFTETSSGNWACCWSGWGCYGCVGGVCKMKCDNQRCRDANNMRPTQTPPKKYQRIKGLAPADTMAPIAPKPKKPLKAPTTQNTVQ